MGPAGGGDHRDYFVWVISRAPGARREARIRADAGERRSMAAQTGSSQRRGAAGAGKEAGGRRRGDLEQLSEVPGGFQSGGDAIAPLPAVLESSVSAISAARDYRLYRWFSALRCGRPTAR